jgi:hypothetical protein
VCGREVYDGDAGGQRAHEAGRREAVDLREMFDQSTKETP